MVTELVVYVPTAGAALIKIRQCNRLRNRAGFKRIRRESVSAKLLGRKAEKKENLPSFHRHPPTPLYEHWNILTLVFTLGHFRFTTTGVDCFSRLRVKTNA